VGRRSEIQLVGVDIRSITRKNHIDYGGPGKINTIEAPTSCKDGDFFNPWATTTVIISRVVCSEFKCQRVVEKRNNIPIISYGQHTTSHAFQHVGDESENFANGIVNFESWNELAGLMGYSQLVERPLPGGGQKIWQWKDDTEWKSYPPAVSEWLQTLSPTSRTTFPARFGLENYEVDLGKQVQIRTSSGYERTIRYTAPNQKCSNVWYPGLGAFAWSRGKSDSDCGTSLLDIARCHVRGEPTSVLMFHGSSSNSAHSICDEIDWSKGGGYLGTGFYLTFSPNEAKTYGCLKANTPSPHNGTTQRHIIVLEVVVKDADQIILNTHFRRNGREQWRNQICGQEFLVGKCKIARVHKFDKHTVRTNSNGYMFIEHSDTNTIPCTDIH
tara:strand:- start:911 stop:2065 length:1155 start_codon:yes stop_codon:yes gene_type:complete